MSRKKLVHVLALVPHHNKREFTKSNFCKQAVPIMRWARFESWNVYFLEANAARSFHALLSTTPAVANLIS